MNFRLTTIPVLLSISFIIISTFFISPLVTVAAEGEVPGPCTTSGVICNPITERTIDGFIRTILEGVLKIGIPIVALAVIYCGFLFVAARGNPEKITKARSALLYTVIGAAILLGSWAIAQLVSDTVLAL